MTTYTNLVPVPRAIEDLRCQMALTDRCVVRLVGPVTALRAAGRVVCDAVARETGLVWTTVAGGGGPEAGVAAVITVDPAAAPPQGYRLEVGPGRVTITGGDAAGAFYGAQTLAQMLRLHPRALPGVRIEDAPDFPARGIMLDVSRDRVPTMATLYRLVDEMAALKLNQLQLYTEHTFAYRAHPTVWAEASPITGEEVLALDAYCRERFVELVPNQNSFGHMDRWLKHPQYRPIAEAPDGFDYPWGGHADAAFSLCPGDPRAIELVGSMFDELLPHFTSPLFNVGCDETWDLGQGRSRDVCAERGIERVYLEFLHKVHAEVARHGRTMQFWGDIILHKPDLVRELPTGVVALEWGYEANHPFDADGAVFAAAGVPFYVCPGTSSWNTIAGRTDNAVGNLLNAAENGRKHGAIGYLNTDWGDNGHVQPLPVSWLGYTAGAAFSWGLDANRSLDIPAALDVHVFRDGAGVMGRLAYDLGNAYQAVGKIVGNASALFNLLLWPANVDGITVEGARAAEEAVLAAVQPLASARMDRDDAALVRDEMRLAADMMAWACSRSRLTLGEAVDTPEALAAELARIRGEHRRVWLARSRPGGLTDSLARLQGV